VDASDACTATCKEAVCGDGLLQIGVEACDDGNLEATDGCTAVCEFAACGDGVVGPGEACDDGNQNEADGCNNLCALVSCGDGVVAEGVEVCDDGNKNDQDACLSTCVLASCGDGFVQAGVEVCDDGNAIDADACTNACQPAICGDGIVLKGQEQCDDGNMLDTDACVAGCKLNVCGDGFLQAGVEACDDGNKINGDGCQNDCTLQVKIVFATSEMYTGNLGGLAGADAKCQALALAAKLPGVYMAWLSDANKSPKTRMTQSTVPYVLPDGTKIADNWADLVDGTLDAALNRTEIGGPVPIGTVPCEGGNFKTVWTGTSTSGGPVNVNQMCSNWTSLVGWGHTGRAPDVNFSWTAWCAGDFCDAKSPLYCFQQ
jgi:cysteine-rich repeat protein